MQFENISKYNIKITDLSLEHINIIKKLMDGYSIIQLFGSDLKDKIPINVLIDFSKLHTDILKLTGMQKYTKDKLFMKEIIEYNPLAIRYVNKELCDVDLAVCAIKKDIRAYTYIDDKIIENEQIINILLEQLQNQTHISIELFNILPSKIKSNKGIILKILSLINLPIYSSLPLNIKNDKEIVLLLLNKIPLIYLELNDTLLYDMDIFNKITYIIKNSLFGVMDNNELYNLLQKILLVVYKNQISDEDLINIFLTRNIPIDYNRLCDKLKDNISIALKLAAINDSSIFNYFPIQLITDRHFILKLVEVNPKIIKYILESDLKICYRTDEDILLTAAKNASKIKILKYIRICNDDKIPNDLLWKILEYNPESTKYLYGKTLNDEKLIGLIEKNYKVYKYMGVELKKNIIAAFKAIDHKKEDILPHIHKIHYSNIEFVKYAIYIFGKHKIQKYIGQDIIDQLIY